jgi:hypothetical protein
MNYVIDNASSKLTIRTRAQGMLARLAHDLSILARSVEGQAEVLDKDRWSATLTVAPSLFVEGVLKGERVDTTVLSAADRQEIERRLLDEILRRKEVRVEASGSTRTSGRAKITMAGGSADSSTQLQLRERDDGSLEAKGHAELSLQALGVPPIKAPLNAFKVADTVVVQFTLVLRQAP